MRVLGIDPGLGTTGYGVVDSPAIGTFKVIEAGFIKAPRSATLSARLARIYRGLDDLIRETKPDLIALEELYSHYKHPVTAIWMGHARGIACLVAGMHSIKLVPYPSTKVKKAIAGNGRASKLQVQRMVTTLLGLQRPPESEDVSDALAVALSHFYIESKRFFG